MKKIFTLLFALTAMSMAWAEAPVLLFKGEPVQADKVYDAGYVVDDSYGDAFVLYAQEAFITLKAKTGAKVTINVLSSESVSFCSGGNCTNGTDQTKTVEIGANASEIVSVDGAYTIQTLQIDKDITPMPGEPVKANRIQIEVKAFYVDNPDEVATAKVDMLDKPDSEVGGIADVAVNKGSVTLRGNTLDYNVKAPTKLEIFNLSGTLVMSQKINAVGSVSLDSLHPGIYLYRAAGNCGKILLRK